jgi:hypothetical protein
MKLYKTLTLKLLYSHLYLKLSRPVLPQRNVTEFFPHIFNDCNRLYLKYLWWYVIISAGLREVLPIQWDFQYCMLKIESSNFLMIDLLVYHYFMTLALLWTFYAIQTHLFSINILHHMHFNIPSERLLEQHKSGRKKSQSGIRIFPGRWGIIRIQVKFLNTASHTKTLSMWHDVHISFSQSSVLIFWIARQWIFDRPQSFRSHI